MDFIREFLQRSDYDRETIIAGFGAVCFLTTTLVVSTLVVMKRRNNKQVDTYPSDTKKQSIKDSIEMTKSHRMDSSATHQDVWADRAKKGISPASLNTKQGAGEARPFGSSYYFAHNNPKSTGGYKDGLRMEDYTMNQPRLLRRGNTSVIEQVVVTNDTTITASSNKEVEPAAKYKTEKSAVPDRKRTLAVSKYLWDDNDGQGHGTIRVDELPTPILGQTITWKDANISRVEASVKSDNGLLVVMVGQSFDYRLNIPELYDKVLEVKATIKAKKRLLVKLTKRASTNAWPHPHKK
jgi:hypothetical protein